MFQINNLVYLLVLKLTSNHSIIVIVNEDNNPASLTGKASRFDFETLTNVQFFDPSFLYFSLFQSITLEVHFAIKRSTVWDNFKKKE